MRARLLTLLFDDVDFQGIMPSDLDLNKQSDKKEMREQFIENFLVRKDQYDERFPIYRSSYILAKQVVRFILKQIKRYENFILQRLAVETEYESEDQNEKNRRLAILKKFEEACQERELTGDQLDRIVTKVVIDYASKDLPDISQIETVLKNAMTAAVAERAVLMPKMPYIPHVPPLAMPDKQLQNLMQYAIKKVFKKHQAAQWKGFCSILSNNMRIYNLLAALDKEWSVYRNQMMGEARTECKLGLLHAKKRQDDQALQYYHQALRKNLQLSLDFFLDALCYGRIADIYNSPGKFYDNEQAVGFYKKAIIICCIKKVARSTNKDEIYAFIFSTYFKIGTLYFEREKEFHDSGQQYYKRALDLCVRIYGEQSLQTAKCCADLGTVCVSVGEYTMAQQCFSNALQLYRLFVQHDKINLMRTKLRELQSLSENATVVQSTEVAQAQNQGAHHNVKQLSLEQDEKKGDATLLTSSCLLFSKSIRRAEITDRSKPAVLETPPSSPRWVHPPSSSESLDIFGFLKQSNSSAVVTTKVEINRPLLSQSRVLSNSS